MRSFFTRSPREGSVCRDSSRTPTWRSWRAFSLGALGLGLLASGACASDPGIGSGGGGTSSGATGGAGPDAGATGGTAGSGAVGGTGGSAQGGTTQGGSGGSGGGGWPSTGFGSPCDEDADCGTGQCSDIGKTGANKVCTGPCQATADCPDDGYCAFHSTQGYICIPDNDNQCGQCVLDTDCPNIGDRCLIAPANDRFCGRDCSFDGAGCQVGFECVDPAGYGAVSGTGGAGGAGTGGAGTGGAATGGSGGGPAPTPNAAMVCVPTAGDSCVCEGSRDGVARRCESQSGGLVCEGTETCDVTTGDWVGCTASSPSAEICDGADNDCNGVADDSDDQTMCAPRGDPANTDWVCNQGACELGPCEPGWSAYPPSLPLSVGCACPVEANEPNDGCASASAVGSVSDGSLNSLTISGRLSSDSDVDWYTFDTVDTDEGTTNSYSLHIEFSAPATNTEFEFAVIRGNTCASPDAAHSGLDSYTWCVDGTGTDTGGVTIGEENCGPTDIRHCGPHGLPYLVRVTRKSGAVGSCEEYRLTVTAQGAGNCDMTASCDPQVDETGVSM